MRLVHVLRRQALSCICMRLRGHALLYSCHCAVCARHQCVCMGRIAPRLPGHAWPSVPSWEASPARADTAVWCAAQVTPEWERLTAHIEADPESKEKLG